MIAQDTSCIFVFFINSYFVAKTKLHNKLFSQKWKRKTVSMLILLNDFDFVLFSAASGSIFGPTVFFITIDFTHDMKPLGIWSDYV
jgi:hypothetical protein